MLVTMVYSISDVAIAMVGELELADVGTSGRRLTDIREGDGLFGKGGAFVGASLNRCCLLKFSYQF